MRAYEGNFRVAKKTAFVSDQTLAMTIAVATGLIVSGCVVAGAGAISSQLTATDHPEDHPDKSQNTHQDTASNSTPDTPPTIGGENTQTLFDTQSVDTDLPKQDLRPQTVGYAEHMVLKLDHLSFEAHFPNGSKSDPVYQPLMKTMADYRDKLKTQSKAEQQAAESDGYSFLPWSINIEFREIERAGDLVAAAGREISFTGGAHPNMNWQGVIANAETGKTLALQDLFLPRRMQSPALTIALCETLKAEKRARIQDATIHGEPIDCGSEDLKETFARAETTLAASTTKGRFGGVIVMFKPYDLGPYAEGDYVLSVDQAIFRADLRPQYAKLFAESPTDPPAFD